MKATPLIALLYILALSTAAPQKAWTQWSVSVAVESDRFWGGSIENAPERKSFRPYRPTVIQAGVERRTGSIGFGLRIRYTEASLGLEGEEAVVALKGAFTVVGLAPEVSYQLTTVGPGNRVVVHAGPLIEFWHPIDTDSRTRVGAHGGLSLAVPLGARLALTLGGDLALISSPFEEDELIEGYDRRALWRRGFVAGLQYQL